MSVLERFGVSIEDELLARFDALIARRGYASRSEAIRDLVREHLVASRWERAGEEVAGTVTLVYDHHAPELPHLLAELQHRAQGAVVCATHVHLDAHHCLEVVVLRGKAGFVRKTADQLLSTRGVKHGQLVCSTTGQGLE